ncbi:hypothetical protein GDO86_005941 [Hymenochirus boettgeri]|uniref:DUF4097 domain-containing protein n=1 Tax=Hymenochirus boettgeri TaxID=247094 RepID=A0A8T2J8A9_9PIPI|nr:hypothetical protein GDO86_005941 [Hymenochirus boettgeri]
MGSLMYSGRLYLTVARRSVRTITTGKVEQAAGARNNKPLKQWTLIVNPQSRLRVRLPCSVAVSPQDPLVYPHSDRVFVRVSGVDCNVNRGLDLDSVEVRYDEASRQVIVNSTDIDSQSCVEVTTPIRFDVDIKTSGTGCASVKKIECDSCHIKTEKGNCILQSVKSHTVHLHTDGGKVICLGSVHGNMDIVASANSVVEIEKLLGTSINICMDGGELKAKYLYADSSSISSVSGNIILGSAHGDLDLHTEHGSITIDSLDGCLSASTSHGDISVYLSKIGQVNLKSEEGSITVKVPETLSTSVQLSGTKVDVSPDIHLQDIQNKPSKNQINLSASINVEKEKGKWIKAETKRGTVSLKPQNWLQSIKFYT